MKEKTGSRFIQRLRARSSITSNCPTKSFIAKHEWSPKPKLPNIQHVVIGFNGLVVYFLDSRSPHLLQHVDYVFGGIFGTACPSELLIDFHLYFCQTTQTFNNRASQAKPIRRIGLG